MSAVNDGGPAFPGSRVEVQFDPIPNTDMSFKRDVTVHTDGMTLRDYFAAKELAKTHATAICDEPSAYARLADHCYRMADAMLAARSK